MKANMRALYIAYRKIGERHSKKRLWLQGQSLEEAGFNVGSTFKVEITENRITLTLSDTGQLKVSRKKQRNAGYQPIVDINNQSISEFFGKFERAKISFYVNGIIVITYHPIDKLIAQRLNKTREAISQRTVSIGSNAHGGGIMTSAIHAGLSSVGFKGNLMFAIEKEPKYIESSLNNSPVWSGQSLVIEGSMEEVETSLLDSVFMYECGLPCTGASVAGRAKNKLAFAEQHETAGRLFYSYLSHIQQINPAIVVLENVKPYVNTVSLHVILDVLDGWGYQTNEAVRILNGHNYGSIENRERMFMICPTKGLDFDWSFEKNHQSVNSCVGDILDDVPDNSHLWSDMEGLKQKQLRDKAKGNSFKMQIVDELTLTTPLIGRGYSKIRSTEPKLSHPTDKSLLRQFTVSEHARLKTIPEHLVSGNYMTTAHQILGQSVIYNLVLQIGQAIGQSLLNYESNNEIKALYEA